MTRQKVCQPLAPSDTAAVSSSAPCSSISGISPRATNGKVTNSVASTMPGTAKMIWISCSRSQGPSRPCSPNSSTKIRPEITGDTAKGRSIRLTSRFLPRNSKRVMHQAAASPKAALSGTQIAATSSVRRMAASAWGSRIAARATRQPSWSA